MILRFSPAIGRVLAAFALATWMQISSAADVPRLPTYDELPLPAGEAYDIAEDGTVSWIGGRPVPGASFGKGSGPGCWKWELVSRRWSPATGARSEAALDLPGMVMAQVALPSGVLSLSTVTCENGDRLRWLLLTRDGRKIALETTEKLGEFAMRLLPLGAEAAVLVTRASRTRHIVAYVIRRNGDRLTFVRMAELPVPYRGDFAATVTADGRLMILGGSDAQYRGCNPCRNETHFLDLAANVWRAGPPMMEGRSELAAGRLPDGSILVSGGWTKKAEWGLGPSATAELWDPRTNRFEALPPMPSGTARHRFVTLPWAPGRVYAVEGVNGSAHVLDLASRTWRTAAMWTEGSEEGGCGFFPFRFEGHTYAWLLNKTDGHYSSKSCIEQKYARLSLVRPFGADPVAPAAPPPSTLITFRGGSAFVPEGRSGDTIRPALLIGGITHAGMNNHLMTATVEAVDRQGRLWALPSLTHARMDAQAFRVGEGVLVIGGTAAWAHLDREGAARVLPMEWLPDSSPSGATGWVEVTGPAPAAGSVLMQLPDGTLLEFARAGTNVTQWKPSVREGRLSLEAVPWPPLPRARQSEPPQEMRALRLNDGRVVVAGGLVQAEKIALYTPDSDRADAPDNYIGIGPYLPSRRHEIFDPKTRRWTTSAASAMAGGSVFLFPDGRVLKTVTEMLPDPANRDSVTQRVTHELASADGSSWRTLPQGWGTGSRLLANERHRVFVVDGEVFAAGELPGPETGYTSAALEWLNPDGGRWEPVWTAGERESWRIHLGRVIVPTLPNGKTVVLPVEGF